MFYSNFVMGLITRSITEFSLGLNTPHIGQLLPDIWVDGKKLYQYQRLDDGEGQGYMLTCDKMSVLDPYEYAEDNSTVTTTVIPLDCGRLLIAMSA